MVSYLLFLLSERLLFSGNNEKRCFFRETAFFHGETVRGCGGAGAGKARRVWRGAGVFCRGGAGWAGGGACFFVEAGGIREALLRQGQWQRRTGINGRGATNDQRDSARRLGNENGRKISVIISLIATRLGALATASPIFLL